MSDSTKMNLEELRKSFPVLDDFSKEKLIGGGPGPGTVLIQVGNWEHNDQPVYQEVPLGNPSGGGPFTGGPSGGPATASAAGSAYFGDSDWGSNSWGDGGMGDGGWGDGDPGGDSNPGGSEGGNGQNSSGNPGSEGREPGPRLDWSNETVQVYQAYTLLNASSNVIAYLIEGTGTVQFLYPGQQTNEPIEGINVMGNVYKLTDGYNWVIVTDVTYHTNYPAGIAPGTEGYQVENGGYMAEPLPGENWWWDLFDFYPPPPGDWPPLPWPPPFATPDK